MLLKGDENDRIWINVYEGPSTSLPEANKPVGVIEIKGKMISRDIAKGSDIEITISISESRDLTVSAYLNMAEQEFKEVFNPKVRNTNVSLLKEQVSDLYKKLDEEIERASEKEEFETAQELKKLKEEMETITEKADRMTSDDVTDDKFKIEDRKRKIAQGLDAATKNKRIEAAKEHYFKTKEECKKLLDKTGNDHEQKTFNDIVSQEEAFFTTNSPLKIQEKSDELNGIIHQINWRTPDFLTNVFNWLKAEHPKMNDQTQAKSLIDAGKFAVESQNWDRLKEINYGLLDLLPKGAKQQLSTKIGFGL